MAQTTTYEYTTIHLTSHGSIADLNRLAAQGWRVIKIEDPISTIPRLIWLERTTTK